MSSGRDGRPHREDLNFRAQSLHVSQGESAAALASILGVPTIAEVPNVTGTVVVYLDVWERLVTPMEDPSLVHSDLGVESCARFMVGMDRPLPGKDPRVCTPLRWVTMAGTDGRGRTLPGLPSAHGDISDAFDGRHETPHFVLLWRQGETTSDELDPAELRVAQLFARLAAEFGPAPTPNMQLVIIFEGDWLSSTGQCQLFHVDNAGRIHLFRFPGPGRGHMSKLGHELVHTFRNDEAPLSFTRVGSSADLLPCSML